MSNHKTEILIHFIIVFYTLIAVNRHFTSVTTRTFDLLLLLQITRDKIVDG